MRAVRCFLWAICMSFVPIIVMGLLMQPKRETILLLQGQTPIEMDLETYVTGVVLAEMPGSFEPEALKAQAAAARTYACKTEKHGEKTVCTNSGCCQGYCAPDAYTGTEETLHKIRTAVIATRGKVLTYEGELIEATYFSCSGGKTEDAQAVWGGSFAYLRSVDSPGEEISAVYCTERFVDDASLQTLLGLEPGSQPKDCIRTQGGGVARITLGNRQFTGTELRKALGLFSTAFEVRREETGLHFTVHGSGHRVGMSQYGAQAMALQGKQWQEILYHYYPGTQIQSIREKS